MKFDLIEKVADCMENINVLNICNGSIWGGIEQYVYDITKEMSKPGMKSFIAVDRSNSMMVERYSKVAEVIPVNFHSIFGLASLFKLKKYIQENNINIINCHSGQSMQLSLLLKFLTGVKIVSFKHNALPSKYDFYHKWQRRQTDAFICVSKLVYDLQTRYLTFNEKLKFHIVYNGIDISKFNQYDYVRREHAKFVIGYAGRICAEKGLDVLLNAFMLLSKKYDDVYLLLAGMDPDNYYKKLSNFIDANDLNKEIQYKGLLSDMEAFYKEIDLFILPSVVKESFGLVLCEALYCGVPVITTDSGAQQEIVDENCGYVVKANDVEDLFKKMEFVYINREFDKVYIKNYIEENFNIKRCVNNLFVIYKTIT